MLWHLWVYGLITAVSSVLWSATSSFSWAFSPVYTRQVGLQNTANLQESCISQQEPSSRFAILKECNGWAEGNPPWIRNQVHCYFPFNSNHIIHTYTIKKKTNFDDGIIPLLSSQRRTNLPSIADSIPTRVLPHLNTVFLIVFVLVTQVIFQCSTSSLTFLF